MTPRQIIAEAWAITTKEHALRRWGFLSALFETLRTLELVLFQAYYLYWYNKGVTVSWMSLESALFERLPFWLFLSATITIGIILVLELFVPTLANGALIGLSAKAKRGEDVKGGLVLGLYNFFPILEVHGIFVLSSIGIVVTLLSMIYRYGDPVGETVKYGAMGIVLFLWLVASLFRFFASFAEEDIVLRKQGVFAGISRSFKIIVSHVGHIFFLIVLLIVISIRILVNAILVFLLPAVALGIGLLLAMFLSPAISTTIAAIIGVVLLIFLSYFLAHLQVFKQTVWTLTYMELSGRKDLDIIIDDD